MADADFIPNQSAGSQFRATDGNRPGVISEIVRLSWGDTNSENLVGDTAGKRLPVKIAETIPAMGEVAHGDPVPLSPILVGYEARTTDGTPVTDGMMVRGAADSLGKQIMLVGATHDRIVSGRANFTTTTAADIIAAQGDGIRIVITSYSITNFHATVHTKVELRDGTTVKIIDSARADGGGVARGGVPLFISTANTAVTARCVTTGADVEVNCSGYTISN